MDHLTLASVCNNTKQAPLWVALDGIGVPHTSVGVCVKHSSSGKRSMGRRSHSTDPPHHLLMGLMSGPCNRTAAPRPDGHMVVKQLGSSHSRLCLTVALPSASQTKMGSSTRWRATAVLPMPEMVVVWSNKDGTLHRSVTGSHSLSNLFPHNDTATDAAVAITIFVHHHWLITALWHFWILRWVIIPIVHDVTELRILRLRLRTPRKLSCVLLRDSSTLTTTSSSVPSTNNLKIWVGCF